MAYSHYGKYYSDGVRIIARSTIVDFAARNPAAKASLAHWASLTKAADWQSTTDVVGAFSKAKVLNGERVRFEVASGAYRLIVAFKFDAQIAFVKFTGTHADYDRIDALTVSDY